MPILVNVSRSYSNDDPRESQLDAIRRGWPLRYTTTRTTTTTLPDENRIRTSGDVLIAVRSNEVVEAQEITGYEFSEGHVRFETTDSDTYAHLIGRRLTAPWAWRRGQGWPIQIVKADDFEDLTDLVEPEGPEPIQQNDIGGMYTVTLQADGNLLVEGPRGRRVTVVSR